MKKVTVLGGGVSGKAAALLARNSGDEPLILNDGGDVSLPSNSQLIVASPGVHPLRSALYKAAAASGIEFIGEMEYAFRNFKGRILAITGTNGKTTTTELTLFLLQKAGIDAVAAGTIGLPLSEVAAAEKQPAVAVVEVSSFQLELIDTFRPEAAVLLNLESDHEDRYAGGFEEYCAVKKKIFDRVTPENQIWGLSFPEKIHRVNYSGDMLTIDGQEILDVSETSLSAPHNRENLAAAVELFLRVVPEKVEILPRVVRDFRCGKHRIEFFYEGQGVRFYDDSKGTNPSAVAAAVNSVPGPVVLLAGGLDKGMDFSILAEVASKVRSVVLYGQCQEPIARVFRRVGVPVSQCGTDFENAIDTAVALAHKGDTVLLSPGCASMDMFKNYQERGEKFKEIVRKKF